jgi:hypothetical protein
MRRFHWEVGPALPRAARVSLLIKPPGKTSDSTRASGPKRMTEIVSALCTRIHRETATRAYKRNDAYMPSGGLRKKASDSIATKLCDTMASAQDAHGG